MNQAHIIARATLHWNNWIPGTSYYELEPGLIQLWKASRDISRSMNQPHIPYSEFKQAVREVSE